MALTNKDASIIIGMIARGDKQHDIAAWFGENQARIVEVEKGSHGMLAAAPASELFPKGSPGLKCRKLKAFVEKAVKYLDEGKVDLAANELKHALSEYHRSGS
ncbi:MAG: hypothetical protein ACRC14_12155 [Paracoccaceae bacterium]